VINADGQRFCNELGRRDYVTGEMWKSKPPFRNWKLVIGKHFLLEKLTIIDSRMIQFGDIHMHLWI
jgi:hypothetical protein